MSTGIYKPRKLDEELSYSLFTNGNYDIVVIENVLFCSPPSHPVIVDLPFRSHKGGVKVGVEEVHFVCRDVGLFEEVST